MKNIILFLSTLLTFLAGPATARNLQAAFSYCTFYQPGKAPFVETYLAVDGKSVYYQSAPGGGFQAAIEISIIVRTNDSVRYFDKYNLLGPVINDTLESLQSFKDLQRIPLGNGKHEMSLTVKDLNNAEAEAYTITQDLSISYYPEIISISDIELLSSYRKSDKEGPLFKHGYEIIPLVDNFFGADNNTLRFFAEYYNTGMVLGKSDFLLSYQIVNHESRQIAGDYSRFSRESAGEAGILLSEFDITGLPSGNYDLVISIRNKQNELLAMKNCFFQRSRPVVQISDNETQLQTGRMLTATFEGNMNNRDSLAEYIRCLWPISSPNENNFALNQLNIAELELMQQFFYDFWKKRNENTPHESWNKYKAEVEKVNQSYSSGPKKGYMTERGRVYLKYGAPNQISRAYNEPATYPYEIWQYYTLGNQSNRKFVFYCPEIGGNDFSLLHSDARGEIFEAQWMVILKRRTETLNDVDKTKARKTFGDQSEQLFQNPR